MIIGFLTGHERGRWDEVFFIDDVFKGLVL